MKGHPIQLLHILWFNNRRIELRYSFWNVKSQSCRNDTCDNCNQLPDIDVLKTIDKRSYYNYLQSFLG